MKNLLIMRHAKSDYPADTPRDFDRPLSRRGAKDAPRMASLVKTSGLLPQRILSSSAMRATQTARIMAAGLGLADEQLRFEERLYLGAIESLDQAVAELPDAITTLLVIGHNPGLEEWLARLCGGKVRLPTAALAAIALPISCWSAGGQGHGQLQWLVTPRLIKAMHQEPARAQ